MNKFNAWLLACIRVFINCAIVAEREFNWEKLLLV